MTEPTHPPCLAKFDDEPTTYTCTLDRSHHGDHAAVDTYTGDSLHTWSARVTTDQPTCPTWCTVPAAEHDAEARDRAGSWFMHQHTVLSNPDETAGVQLVTLERAQLFTEQRADGEEVDPLYVTATADETLTLTQATELRDALTTALQLAGRAPGAHRWSER